MVVTALPDLKAQGVSFHMRSSSSNMLMRWGPHILSTN